VLSCILPTTKGLIALGSTAPYNASLVNTATLRQNLEKHGAIFHSSSDTEVIMHLIRRSKAPTFEEALKESYEWKIAPCFSRFCLKDCALIRFPLWQIATLIS
jgi:glutamine phosphoribosylpyrophosphate amidotransferase